MPGGDDLWLNEAFATWLSTKTLINTAPEFESHLYRVRQRNGVFEQDALPSARKIRQPIEHQGDIRNAFDGITYTKGAAVLHMIESWIGPDVFQQAVQSYMTKHAHKTATTADLLAELEAASGKPVGDVLSTFIDQAGVPVLELEPKCKDGKGSVQVTQSPYRALGDTRKNEEAWKLPVCVTWHKGKKSGTNCGYLLNRSQRFPLDVCADWVEGNTKETGYYLWSYKDSAMWSKLNGKKAQKMVAEETRVSLPGQLRSLFAAGHVSGAEFVDTTLTFLQSDNDGIVAEGMGNLGVIEGLLKGKKGADKALQKKYGKALKSQVKRIGMVPQKNEAASAGFLRGGLMHAAVRVADHKKAANFAAKTTKKFLKDPSSVTPDTARLAVAMHAKNGDQKLWGQLAAKLRTEKHPAVRRALLAGLGSFMEPVLYTKSLNLILSEKVRFQNYWRIVGPSFHHPTTKYKVFWTWFTQNFDALRKLAGDEGEASLVWAMGGVCSESGKKEGLAFFSDKNLPAGAARNQAQVIESIDQCMVGKAKNGPGVAKALKVRGK